MAQTEFTAEAVSKLTKAQREVLGLVCINRDDEVLHRLRTLAKLIELGWIMPRRERLPGAPSITITRYDVSCHAAHMAWCAWCSENITDEELAAADAEMRAK